MVSEEKAESMLDRVASLKTQNAFRFTPAVNIKYTKLENNV